MPSKSTTQPKTPLTISLYSTPSKLCARTAPSTPSKSTTHVFVMQDDNTPNQSENENITNQNIKENITNQCKNENITHQKNNKDNITNQNNITNQKNDSHESSKVEDTKYETPGYQFESSTDDNLLSSLSLRGKSVQARVFRPRKSSRPRPKIDESLNETSLLLSISKILNKSLKKREHKLIKHKLDVFGKYTLEHADLQPRHVDRIRKELFEKRDNRLKESWRVSNLILVNETDGSNEQQQEEEKMV